MEDEAKPPNPEPKMTEPEEEYCQTCGDTGYRVWTASGPSPPCCDCDHHKKATVRVQADHFGQILLLQVEDSGPGVPLGERELIFQPFYRALGSEADGSGLGLPIVMEIARQHGAQVLLQDARPAHTPPGALFTVRFKAMPGQQ